MLYKKSVYLFDLAFLCCHFWTGRRRITIERVVGASPRATEHRGTVRHKLRGATHDEHVAGRVTDERHSNRRRVVRDRKDSLLDRLHESRPQPHRPRVRNAADSVSHIRNGRLQRLQACHYHIWLGQTWMIGSDPCTNFFNTENIARIISVFS